MKYRIRKTNEIVDVVGYSACTHTRFPGDYVCYIDSKGEEIVGRGLNLIWDFEPILSEDSTFDWQSFCNQATKDILCATLSGGIASGATGFMEEKGNIVKAAISIADELIKQLKEKEEK